MPDRRLWKDVPKDSDRAQAGTITIGQAYLMGDKAVAVITEAVRRVQTYGPFIDGFQGLPESYTSVILDALKVAGIALVELQSVDGLRFTHEDGTPYTATADEPEADDMSRRMTNPGLIQTEDGIKGTKHVDHNLKAVMLPDGKWYTVEDPTLPNGPDGYLSFLQHIGDQFAMVNVAIRDIKAVAYYGHPASGLEGRGKT